MPSTSKKSAKSKGKGQFWQKAVLFIGGGAFLGTAMLPIIGGLFNRNEQNTPAHSAGNQGASRSTAELQELEANLLLVLEREPNNPNALQNLTRVRLEMGDLPGAIDPLDKLITLFPEDQVLKDLKVQLEQNIVQTNPQGIPVEENVSPTTTPDIVESEATDGLEVESEAVPETEDTENPAAE
ncbi:hypothetical protein Lepto7376_1703 [[Leptolyngbya] sp. PCC 7376]|uniref:tetratricopeptide repeat protein n=1 Tax=[Leptolyngbya] sp. PCC 7376 TaxID=111781 RepID=UPI00029F1167|nr:tetratricopeptide repeat protein [[Leptolyngbya] sp. PCC 7376]AFY38037.1 hypothetical protein Lepto7376_1703 [[Leptolyngbya] sp. PCC 7376]